MKKLLLILFITFSYSASAQLSNDSLLAYYPFNGTVTDMSGNGYNGIPNGVSYTANCDKMGNAAILFDGVNDFVDLSSFATTFRNHLDTMTIFFKIRFDKMTDNQTILSLGNLGDDISTNVFEVEYENNQLQVETEAPDGSISHFNSEIGIEKDTTLPFFNEQCHEIMITLLNDSLTYYRNGVMLFKNTYTPTQTTTVNMFLGSHGSTSSNPCCYFGGLLDELQFYNRILDISETQGAGVGVSVKNQQELAGLEVFPNPSNGIVQVLNEMNNRQLTIDIYNIEGKKINSVTLKGQKTFEIELPEPKGMYYLNVLDRNNVNSTFKVLKN